MSSSSVICQTTGPKPLPKQFLHIVRSRASSFNWQCPLLSLRSYSSFLRLLPRLLVTSILRLAVEAPTRTALHVQTVRYTVNFDTKKARNVQLWNENRHFIFHSTQGTWSLFPYYWWRTVKVRSPLNTSIALLILYLGAQMGLGVQRHNQQFYSSIKERKVGWTTGPVGTSNSCPSLGSNTRASCSE